MKRIVKKSILVILFAMVWAAVAQADETAFKFLHPWQKVKAMSQNKVIELKTFVEPIIQMDDQDIVALIPSRRPVDSDLSQLGDQYDGEIEWTPSEPKIITINNKKIIPEEEFQPTEVDKVEGPDGRIWSYEYVVGKNGKKVYITSIRDLAARDWLQDAAINLARLYVSTGNEIYAQKAAIIIARFADVIPSYVVYGSRSGKGTLEFYSEEPYPQNSGLWGTWYMTELTGIEPIVLAYDLILHSGAIQALSSKWNRDVKSEIDKFLIDYFLLIKKYDRWYATTLATRTNNKQPGKCRGMIAIGRTVDKPEIIHYAFTFLEEIINKRFGLDGVFPESPSYHLHVVKNLNIAFEYLNGYSDPPNYIDKLTKRHLDNFNSGEEFTAFKKAESFMNDCSFPDGTPMGVHDTYVSRMKKKFKQRDITQSRIWPSFGHAVLGRGNFKNQMEVHLDFGFDFMHKHNDTLNMILWACQEELLSDLGYTYTYRGWTTSSLSHNLVVVDRMVQQAGNLSIETPENAIGGRIETWAPVSNGFGVIEAEDINSYPQCSTYRRSLMVVEDSEENAFVVDIFEVAGGRQHDYMAHGSADKDQKLTFNKTSTLYADSLSSDGKIHIASVTKDLWGSSYKYQDFDSYGEESQYWGNIRKAKKVSGAGPWEGTFSGNEESDAKLRMHLLAPTDSEIYFGEAPSIRRGNEDPLKVEDYMMPIFTARRSGENLNSRFVTVWEPYQKNTFLNSAKLERNESDGIILKIETNKNIHTIFWEPSGDKTLNYGEVTFKGRFGLWVRPRQPGLIRYFGVNANFAKASAPIVNKTDAEITLVQYAGRDEKGEYIRVSDQIELTNVGEPWGILIFPQNHTIAIRLGDVENGNIIRCPDGHGLYYDQSQSTWHEKYSPGRSFTGQIKLHIIKRMFKEIGTPTNPEVYE